MGGKPLLGFETLITDPARGRAVALQTVAWGVAGSAAERVGLDLDDQDARVRPSRRGAFVLPAGPRLSGAPVTTTVAYQSGETQRERFNQPSDEPGLPGLLRRPRLELSDQRPVIAARAPDPNGGLPWGVAVVPATDGTPCPTRAERIVGDQVGAVDDELGTFQPALPSAAGCTSFDEVSDETAVLLQSSSGADPAGEPDADPAPARIARRTLPGRTTYSGTVRPGVRTVTIATPRDVRTLRPSSVGRAIIAVYDGTFPAGETVLTSTFADGSTVRQVIPGMF